MAVTSVLPRADAVPVHPSPNRARSGEVSRKVIGQPHRPRVPARRGDLLRVLLVVPDGPRIHHELPADPPRRHDLGRLGELHPGLARPAFGQAWRNTLYFTLLALVIGYALPFFIAIMLNEFRHAQGYLRVLVYLPVMLPPASGLLLFKYAYDPDDGGIFNFILHTLHLPTSQWVQSPDDDDRRRWSSRPPG